MIGGTSFGTFGLPFELGAAVLTFGLPLALPLSFMFAILRYRLWDIDIVVNRALVYGVLTAALVGIYFGGIILIQMAFRAVTGQENAVAVVISTLAIAALFMPLRSRIQDFIDRRFYRRKYDAAQTLAAFSIRMRDEVDLEQLGRTTGSGGQGHDAAGARVAVAAGLQRKGAETPRFKGSSNLRVLAPLR